MLYRKVFHQLVPQPRKLLVPFIINDNMCSAPLKCSWGRMPGAKSLQLIANYQLECRKVISRRTEQELFNEMGHTMWAELYLG